MREKNHWSLRSFSTPGDDSWKESHWREAIQLHKVWQELLRIEILKSTIRGSMKEATNEVSGVFPHHNSWRELQWREAIQLHRVWQEIFMIKRLEVQSEDPWRKQPLKCNKCDRSFSTSGEDSWRESHWREAIQLHKVGQELLRIKILKKVPSEDPWRKQPLKSQEKGITMERSHSSALSVARASHDQETWSTIRGSLKETTIEVHQMWQELFHIKWRFMRE